jgi:SOS-response transcriptional repressor LexA
MWCYPKEVVKIKAEDWNLDPERIYLGIHAKDSSMLGRGIGKGYLVIFTDLEVLDGDVAVVNIKDKLCARIVRYCGNSIYLLPTDFMHDPVVIPQNRGTSCIFGKAVLAVGNPNGL